MFDFSRFFENATDLFSGSSRGDGLDPTVLLERTGFDKDAIADLVDGEAGSAAGDKIAEVITKPRG